MELSVLIPSHKRPEVLARTLQHLAEQDPLPEFEVIVCIDGDHDHTPARLDYFKKTGPFFLTVLQQPHSGHGTALNLTLKHARGTYCLIIGDDIFASKHFTWQHLTRLKELNQREVAVQGLTKWHPELLPNAFLEWESTNGAIFAFPRMRPFSLVSAEYLFTSNVSFTTEWLRSTEGFPENVMWDMDTVFAFRAQAQKLKLYYDPEALAWHYHTWSVETEAGRRYVQGRLAAHLEASDPQYASFVTQPRMTPWRKLRYGASRLVRPGAERFGPRALKGWCWIHELNYRFAQGYLDQKSNVGDLHSFQRSP